MCSTKLENISNDKKLISCPEGVQVSAASSGWFAEAVKKFPEWLQKVMTNGGRGRQI
jgi:hypothetical protein